MKNLILTVMLFYCMNASAQFQRSYGTENREQGRSVIQVKNPEKGYLTAGYTGKGFLSSTDATLLKTDLNGSPDWAKVYGGEGRDFFNCVRQMNVLSPNFPLRYVAFGATNSFGYGNSDMYLVGTDASGTPLYSKVYGGAAYDRGTCIQPNRDEQFGRGLIMVGETRSFPSLFPGSNIYVVKTDLFGTPQQSVIIGGEGNQIGYWIYQTKDLGYVIAGTTTRTCRGSSGPNPVPQIFILKLKPDLSVEWDRIVGAQDPDLNLDDRALSITEDAEGSIIATGVTRTYGVGNAGDAFLLKFDAGGGFQWFKTYGMEKVEQGYSVLSEMDASGRITYTVSGQSNSFPSASPDQQAYVFKTDDSGSLLWTRVYGLDRSDRAFEINRSRDVPGYVFTGSVSSYGAGSTDILLVETDTDGRSQTDCEREVQQKKTPIEPCISEGVQFVHVKRSKKVSSKYLEVDYKLSRCPLAASSDRMRQMGPEEPYMEGQGRLQYSPNPASTVLNVSHGSSFSGGKMILISPHGGTVLLEQGVGKSPESQIDVFALPKGIYILQLISPEGKTEQVKFMKD